MRVNKIEMSGHDNNMKKQKAAGYCVLAAFCRLPKWSLADYLP